MSMPPLSNTSPRTRFHHSAKACLAKAHNTAAPGALFTRRLCTCTWSRMPILTYILIGFKYCSGQLVLLNFTMRLKLDEALDKIRSYQALEEFKAGQSV